MLDQVRQLVQQVEHGAKLLFVAEVDQLQRPHVFLRLLNRRRSVIRAEPHDIHRQIGLEGACHRHARIVKCRSLRQNALTLALALEFAAAHAQHTPAGQLDPACEQPRRRALVVGPVLTPHVLLHLLHHHAEVRQAQALVAIGEDGQADDDVRVRELCGHVSSCATADHNRT